MTSPRLTALREALAAVEAASEGSVALDMQIDKVLYPDSKKWPDDILKYTRSLDAKVPGENIVVMRYYPPPQDNWWAAHSEKRGQLIGAIGTTEILARRAAGLRALIAKEEAEGDIR